MSNKTDNTLEGLAEAVESFNKKTADIDSVLKAAREAAEKKDSEVKELVFHGERMASDLKGIADRLSDAEQRLEERVLSGVVSPRDSLHEALSSAEYKLFASGKTNGFSFEIKTITTEDSNANPDGAVISPQRLEGIRVPADAILGIEDDIPSGTTSTDNVQFSRQASANLNTRAVKQGRTYNESQATFEIVDAPVRRVGTFFNAPRSAIEDSAQLSAYINSRLVYAIRRVVNSQIISGNGSNGSISGLTLGENSTAFTPANNNAATAFDNLNTAVGDLQGAGYNPTAIVMQPAAFWALNKLKDSTGRYLLDGPQSVAAPSLWGVPVVLDSNAALADKFLLADFPQYTQIFNRTGIEVELSRENQNNVVLDQITVLGRRRFALPVYDPAASRFGLLKKA